MANLVGSDIGLNYKGLINLGATVNQNVSGSLQYLTDGDGNNLPIQVSTTATQINYGVGIGGAPTTSGLHVYGQAGTTGLVFGGAAATMYIDLNGTGINFFDAAQTRYRNFANTTLAMNVWGSLGMVAIGGSPASPYTPTAMLQVRGDAVGNNLLRVENSAGVYRILTTATRQIFNVGSGNQFMIRADEGTTSSLGFDFQVYSTTAGPRVFIGSKCSIGLTSTATNTGMFFSNIENVITADVFRFSFIGPGTAVINTTGTTGGISYVDLFSAGAGSGNYRPLSINYTINNTGAQTGNTTGIFSNATVTNLNGMSLTLMDLQVNAQSRLRYTHTSNTGLQITRTDNAYVSASINDNGIVIHQNLGLVCSYFTPAAGNTVYFTSAATIGSNTVSSARLHVRGDGTNAIGRFETSAGVEAFGISNTGVVNFSTTSGTITITPGVTPILSLSTFFASGGGLQIQMNVSALSGAGTISKFVFTQAYTLTGASATNVNELVINPSFSATANPGVFNGILFSSTINQTSGANGITRGLFVNPTLTSAADFRGIEVRTGSTAAHDLILLSDNVGNKILEVNAAQQIGLFGVPPIAQPTTAITSAVTINGGGTTVHENSTFGGYTIAQIAQALINLGILRP